jgi:hypothetical protein
MDILSHRRALALLIGIDLGLVLLHVVCATIIEDYSWTVANWFNLDAELNVPTWFSSAQLMLISVIAFAVAGKTHAGPLRRALVLAVFGFLFLSLDETASIHEGTTQIFKSLGVDSSRHYVPGVWTIIYPVLGLAALGVFRREAMAFLADPPGREAFLWGATILVTGGLLLEIAAYFIVPETGADSIYAFIQICLEEGCEMIGASLMVYAMLLKLKNGLAWQP